MVQHPEREDCYIARLVVKKVSPVDSRRYFLHVENAHGTDKYAVTLNVKGNWQLHFRIFFPQWSYLSYIVLFALTSPLKAIFYKYGLA